MKVVKRNLRELNQYVNNPRHNGNAVEAVKQSILKYGYKVPIIIDINNVIIAGHTRFAALLEINEERNWPNELDCILADDLTEEEVNEFRIVDNLVAEYADWDITKLKTELELLPNLDLSLFGDIPALTIEEIQIQEEQKLELNSDKIMFKIGPDKFEITEGEYHDWVQYVIGKYNISIVEFVKRQLELAQKDRTYERVEI